MRVTVFGPDLELTEDLRSLCPKCGGNWCEAITEEGRKAGEIQLIEKYEKRIKELQESCAIGVSLAAESLEAGRKEVVEWLETQYKSYPSYFVFIGWDKWQAKLKEWGIEEV